MATNNPQVPARVTKELWNQIDTLRKKRGQTWSEFVRRLFIDALKKKGRAK